MTGQEKRDKAREELCLYRKALDDIQFYEERVDELRLKLDNQAIDSERVKVQSQSLGAEPLMIVLCDYLLYIKNKQVESERLCMAIEKKVDKVPDALHRRILRSYWLYLKSFTDIAEREGYSYDYILEIHRKALESYGAL